MLLSNIDLISLYVESLCQKKPVYRNRFQINLNWYWMKKKISIKGYDC